MTEFQPGDRIEHPHPDWYNAFPPQVMRLKNGKWEARAGNRYVLFASPVGGLVDQFSTRWFAKRAARRLAKRLYREQQRESESRWEMA